MSDIPNGDRLCSAADLRTEGAQLQYWDMPPPGREDLMVTTLTKKGLSKGSEMTG